MPKNKDTVINIRPYTAEIEITRTGFTLIFTAGIKGTYERRKKVKVHFEDWWMKYLAVLLWKVIKRRRADVDELEQSMTER